MDIYSFLTDGYQLVCQDNSAMCSKVKRRYRVLARGPRGARRCKYSLRGGGQFKKARGIGTHRRRQYRLLRNRKGKGFTFQVEVTRSLSMRKEPLRVISEEVEEKKQKYVF